MCDLLVVLLMIALFFAIVQLVEAKKTITDKNERIRSLEAGMRTMISKQLGIKDD